MEQLSATEASRGFKDLLNRVADGESFEILRNGAVVAVIGPPRPRKKRFLSGTEFRELMESLPPADENFVRDLEEIRRRANANW